MSNTKDLYGITPYNPPKTIMTDAEYHERVLKLGECRNNTTVSSDFLQEVEDLRNALYDMNVYDTSELPVNGTKYYVTNLGDDNNDGLTPKTAWATLEKVSTFEFDEGDGVYFKRGDLWRGNLVAKSGVTYQAFGTGEKPKIWFSFDGKTAGKWVKTDMENIWVLDTPLNTSDVGVILFNGGEKYANKKRKIADIKQELDFCFAGECSNEDTPDDKAYLYCSSGNPGEIFSEIELSRRGSTITIANYSHDIYLHNLELRFGQDYFFMDYSKNINMSYCLLAWMGGHYFGKNGCRYGGGGGCWHTCNKMEIHHCYLTQHFDCSASPQFNSKPLEIANEHQRIAAHFKDFSFHDNLIEYTEYSFEFFITQFDSATGACFDRMYVGHNFCRKCDKGFGDKHGASKFLRGGLHENNCKDTVFEKNIFDRSGALAIELSCFEGDQRKDQMTYDYLPALRENIYIDPRDKRFALINRIYYDFNPYSQLALEKLGVEKDSVYIYVSKED